MERIFLRTVCFILYTHLLFGCKFRNNKRSPKQDIEITTNSIFNSYIQHDKGTKLSGDFVFLDSCENKLSISEVTNHSPKLVLRFSNYNCWHCVEECLTALRNSIKDSILDKKAILLIASDYGPRGFHLLREKKVSDFNIYKVNKNMGLKLETLSMPFFFIIDSNNSIMEPFLPIEGKVSNTEKYLKQVFQNYL